MKSTQFLGNAPSYKMRIIFRKKYSYENELGTNFLKDECAMGRGQENSRCPVKVR